MTNKRSRDYDVTFSQSSTGEAIVVYRNKEYFWRIPSRKFEIFSDHSAFSHQVYFNEDNRLMIRVRDRQNDVLVCCDDELIENE